MQRAPHAVDILDLEAVANTGPRELPLSYLLVEQHFHLVHNLDIFGQFLQFLDIKRFEEALVESMEEFRILQRMAGQDLAVGLLLDGVHSFLGDGGVVLVVCFHLGLQEG